ncbi:heavy metal transporter [Nocardia sp. MH4]|uniref:heavy-metal-associated domain-containing protein n=1 Tax=Nocardia TaxID=1817 RepID=UPI001C4F681D|nr:cation transporter [Nocardia sp. MH4]MBW0272558.1 heavy metal transporter [Nocardia sp. MH4]
MATHTFEIQGMHCGSCALLVDDTLEDLPGVRTTQTSMKKGRATVELDPALSSPDDIVTAIAELGYVAAIVE